MRPKIRIYKYLTLFLDNLDKTDLTDTEKQVLLDNKKTIFEYWKDNPDQRLTQVLYNLFSFAKYSGYRYNMECDDYLSDELKVPYKELLLWGTYGKDGDQPLTHKWLDDINTDHIQAILKTQKRINPKYKDTFLTELVNRGVHSHMNDPKFGTGVVGEIRLAIDVLDEDPALFDDILNDADELVSGFESLEIPLYVDYDGDATCTFYYEIPDNIKLDNLIELPLVISKAFATDISKVTHNVFMLFFD